MSAVPTAAIPAQPGTGQWESEGGALKPGMPIPVPEAILAVTTVQYRVGPYSYSRLEDAMAQLERLSRK
ncbi:hypothetical protein [Erythrobacter sp. EC-HK427]|nr:conserved hypothetical protein [Erythrobacter sp. EC-HK427]